MSSCNAFTIASNSLIRVACTSSVAVGVAFDVVEDVEAVMEEVEEEDVVGLVGGILRGLFLD